MLARPLKTLSWKLLLMVALGVGLAASWVRQARQSGEFCRGRAAEWHYEGSVKGLSTANRVGALAGEPRGVPPAAYSLHTRGRATKLFAVSREMTSRLRKYVALVAAPPPVQRIRVRCNETPFRATKWPVLQRNAFSCNESAQIVNLLNV